MLQNARVRDFTISELLREIQQGPLPPTQIRIKIGEMVAVFYKAALQKTNQEEFKMKKVTNRKCNKLYNKWKGSDNLFNSWIHKKSQCK